MQLEHRRLGWFPFSEIRPETDHFLFDSRAADSRVVSPTAPFALTKHQVHAGVEQVL